MIEKFCDWIFSLDRIDIIFNIFMLSLTDGLWILIMFAYYWLIVYRKEN